MHLKVTDEIGRGANQRLVGPRQQSEGVALIKRWLGSLVNRAVALVVIIIILSVLMVTVAGSLLSRSELEEQTRNQVETIASLVAGELDEGATYKGTVKAIKEYGAFVEIVPGKEGLLHISELEHGHVKNVEDVLSVGDEIDVKLLKVEHGGKLRLSRKALLPKPEEN